MCKLECFELFNHCGKSINNWQSARKSFYILMVYETFWFFFSKLSYNTTMWTNWLHNLYVEKLHINPHIPHTRRVSWHSSLFSSHVWWPFSHSFSGGHAKKCHVCRRSISSDAIFSAKGSDFAAVFFTMTSSSTLTGAAAKFLVTLLLVTHVPASGPLIPPDRHAPKIMPTMLVHIMQIRCTNKILRRKKTQLKNDRKNWNFLPNGQKVGQEIFWDFFHFLQQIHTWHNADLDRLR